VGECERIVGRALASGRRNTDWIDLYQVHRPVFDVPQEETLRAIATGSSDTSRSNLPTICSTVASKTSSCRWLCATTWGCSRSHRSRQGFCPAATKQVHPFPSTQRQPGSETGWLRG
jgi:hypothetical protein